MSAHRWLRLDKIKEDSFRGECDAPGPKSRAFGGQVLAQALTAAASTVPKGFYVNSLHCYFIRGGVEKEPIIYEVKRIRNGRNFCIRTVEAVQNGSVIHSSEFSFQREENASSFTVSPAFPSVKPPEDLQTYTFSREQFLATGNDHTLIRPINTSRIAPRCEIRPIDGDTFLQGLLNPREEPLKQYAWFRYLDKVDPSDPALAQGTVAYMSDLTLVNVGLMPYTRGIKFKLSTTLDHSMWYHQWRFDANEWILYEMTCVAHAANRSLVHGRMWSRTGTLIMSSTQEVLIYPDTVANGNTNAKL
uniref:Acyl-CoA thioesterase II n=1 Tax=Panagrellus redivivus TaxID=6233 RepID=A0A7E4VL10_PANRE